MRFDVGVSSLPSETNEIRDEHNKFTVNILEHLGDLSHFWLTAKPFIFRSDLHRTFCNLQCDDSGYPELWMLGFVLVHLFWYEQQEGNVRNVSIECV